MAETIAILLARGGSKGVRGKNLKRIGGVSLVARAVRAANQSKRVSAIFVSSDDQAILEEAASFGARTILRPDELSGDAATSESGWLHGLEIARQEFTNIQNLVFLQCTSPFTTGADIDGCLASMEQAGAACSLSVVSDHSFLWQRGADGFAHGVNHDETKQRKRRQDLPPSYAESGAIYCADATAFEQTGQRFLWARRHSSG